MQLAYLKKIKKKHNKYVQLVSNYQLKLHVNGITLGCVLFTIVVQVNFIPHPTHYEKSLCTAKLCNLSEFPLTNGHHF